MLVFLIIIIIIIIIYNSYNKYWKNHGFVHHLTNLPTKFDNGIFNYNLNNNLFNRVYLFYRKGEGIGYDTIKNHNMNIFIKLYENIEFINFISDIVGEKVYPCPEFDKHRIGIYKYSKKDDFINWHYDKSFYKGTRYTVLITLKNGDIKNNCNLEYIYKDKLYKWNSEKYNMLVFHGDKLYHRVTKMKPYNNTISERIIFTLEYVTDTKINPINKFIDDIKNKVIYKF